MFGIREATRDDNDALLHLESQSPQGTGISILIDRDDYFYRSQLHDRSKVLIAEEDGHLVGIMAYAIKDVIVEGQREQAAYFYDLRGEATYRRSMKRGLFRIWRAALDGMEKEGASFIYGHVKADNNDSMNITTKVGAQPVASFDILSLPSLRGTSHELNPHLDQLDKEITRLRSLVGDRNLKPYDFETAYVRGAQLGYLRGIFRLEQGQSSAQVSAWDLSSIYRSRVLHMPLSLKLLATVLNPLATFLPLPRVPREGEHMQYLQLFDAVTEGPAGVRLLKKLIHELQHLAFAEGKAILTLFMYTDDPLAQMPKFFPSETLHYHTMARPLCRMELPQKPFYLDIRDI